MLTQADVDAIIQAWTRSPAGREYLKKEGVGIYTEQEMQAIASELRAAIASAFVSEQTSVGNANSRGMFNFGATAIKQSGENRLEILYKDAALRRKSLLNENWKVTTYGGGKKKLTKSNYGYTGNGLRDIFAAFTTGWHASNYAYGSWEDAYQTGFSSNRQHNRTFIRSRKDREGSSFIRDTVAHFEAKYPGLKITIPAEWGG